MGFGGWSRWVERLVTADMLALGRTGVAVPIENREEFGDWLEKQPHETCVLIATRAAGRVFPTVAHSHELNPGFALSTARAILTSGVAAKLAPIKLGDDTAYDGARFVHGAVSAHKGAAIDAAVFAAYRAALAADAAAIANTYGDNITHTANIVSNTAGAVDAAADASRLSTGSVDPDDTADDAKNGILAASYRDTELSLSELVETSLWHKAIEPEWLTKELVGSTNVWDSGPEWSFWREWYQGFLDGKAIDWELQRRVALIPDPIWEAGPEAVAEEIERIRAEWLAEKLPQAEDLTRDEDGRYDVKPLAADPDQMIDRLFRQLEFSLDLALRGHNLSGFDDMCTAYKYLDHTRQNCRDDPNAVHMHIRLAREIIEGKLASSEYQSEDALNALVTALERHEVQLRADHPLVRKAHDTFVAQRIRELDDERRLTVAQGFRDLETDSKGRLAEEFVLDAETLEGDTGADAQADALKRSGGRSQKMSIAERAAEATKSVDGSAPNKAMGLMFRLQKLAEMLSGLF